MVELNSGNGNEWVAVEVMGTIGVLADGHVNRDGVGAVVSFTPEEGDTVMSPVTGGASYLSQSSRERIFGLGDEDAAAELEFSFKDLIPNAVYTIWGLRLNTVIPPQGDEVDLPGPLCLPNVFSTDDKGKAEFACKVENPFPGQGQGLASLLRILGVTVAFHNTYQNWGSCFARFGVAVDHHVHLTTGLSAFDALETAAKQ